MAFRSAKQKARAAEIIDALDVSKIADATRLSAPADWSGAQLESIADMIYLAAETWLPQDLDDFRITHIEEKERVPTSPLTRSTVCDIRGFYGPDGEKFVLDWKSAGTVDERWVERMEASWQWRTYLVDTQSDIFIYRGVQKDAGATKELICRRYPGMERDVEEYYRGVSSQIRSLVNEEVYPRNMPSACGAFARQCDHFYDCRNNTMPRGVILPTSISYSSAEHFMLCPERYRREQLAGPGTSIDTLIGSVFHSGMAELYRQLNLYSRALRGDPE